MRIIRNCYLEEVHQMMDGCFKNLMTKIREYEGPIDKSTSDRLSYLLR